MMLIPQRPSPNPIEINRKEKWVPKGKNNDMSSSDMLSLQMEPAASMQQQLIFG